MGVTNFSHVIRFRFVETKERERTKKPSMCARCVRVVRDLHGTVIRPNDVTTLGKVRSMLKGHQFVLAVTLVARDGRCSPNKHAIVSSYSQRVDSLVFRVTVVYTMTLGSYRLTTVCYRLTSAASLISFPFYISNSFLCFFYA